MARFIFAAILLTLPYQAAAQPMACSERAVIVSALARDYGEHPVALGIANNGGVIEVLASAKSWTIILTMPNGVACLVAVGDGWETLPAKKGTGS
jgi:hypothetical protein